MCKGADSPGSSESMDVYEGRGQHSLNTSAGGFIGNLRDAYQSIVHDIIHLELSFLLETPNDVFNYIIYHINAF